MSKANRYLALSIVTLMLLGTVTFAADLGTNLSEDGSLTRYYGEDRYSTAVEISKAGWGKGASVVVLARGDVYADALAGVPLAYANEAPILLTTPKRLPAVTKDEISRLGTSKVYLLGGIGAISQEVEDELVGMELEVVRIKGENRFDTAAKIAMELAPGGAETVFLAFGMNFPDALSAAAYAAIAGAPILLTLTNELPEETLAALETLNPQGVFVIGGSAVISDEVMQLLTGARRLSGNDRFGTSVALAEWFAPDKDFMFIATGNKDSDGADAITGAALAAKKETGILLVGNTLPDSVAEFLGKRIQNAHILGGKSAVSAELAKAIQDALSVPADLPFIPGPGPGPDPVPVPGSDFGFIAPEIVAGTDDISGFQITVKNVSNIGDDVPIRYLMKVTNGSLDGKVIGYGDEDDTFTIDGNEAYFGPAAGFTLTQLPDLKSEIGVTTPFTIKGGLAAGTYKFTVSIVQVGGPVLVTSDEFLFNVADTSWSDEEELIIYTAAELAGFANLVNSGTDFSGKTVKLGANIDLADYEWIPIGTATNRFRGIFDGNNYIVSNLTISSFSASGAGLFGYVTGTLKNLTLESVNINAANYVGALVGSFSTGTIENVDVNNATVIGYKEVNSGNFIGGVVGWGYFTITGCTVSDSQIEGNGISVGGVVGFSGEGNNTISNCSAVNTNVSGYFRTGGLVGLLQYGNTVSDSGVTGGIVTSRPYEGSVPTLNGRIIKTGGFAGDVITTNKNVTITNCETTATLGGDLALYAESVGSFIGNVDSGSGGVLRVVNCLENGNPLEYILLATADQLASAVEDQHTELKTWVLAKDIAIEGQLFIRENITLDGNGKTLTSIATGASSHSAVKIDSLGSGTTIRNLTVKVSGYTGNVLYVSTATDVKVAGNTFESLDNLAMGVYFDRGSSGELTDNVIVGRKGVGADTVKSVTIKNNYITFTNIGIELHDGTVERNTVVINDSEDEAKAHTHYTVSGNTFNKLAD